jgi:GH18 family chitinase
MQIFGLLLAIVISRAAAAQQTALQPPAQARDALIVGYLPDYRCDTFNPRQAGLVTDVVYMAAEPKETGELDLSRVKPAHLALLGRLRKEYRVRTHFALGGWGRCRGFAPLAANAARRERFAELVVRYCREQEFAGVDLDWEFPEGEAQIEDFAALAQVLHTALHADGRTLSIALAPWQRLLKATWRHVDRVHLMAYDHEGRHATYAQALEDVERVLALGVPREKLLLGLPCYARHIADNERTLTWLEIVGRHDPPPNQDEFEGFYYNGPTTVAKKATFAATQGLAGIFFWELGQDTDGSRSLVRAARAAIHKVP